MNEPTVLAALTQAVLEAAGRLGLDAAAVRTEAGLDPALLADPDGRVPLAHHLAMWTAVSRAPIGLQLGMQLGLGGLGVVGYALAHDQSIGDALGFLDHHRALIHADAVPRLQRYERDGEPRFGYQQCVPVPFARLIEPVDAQAAATVALVRALAGADVVPTRVELQRVQPADPTPQQRFYRLTPIWNAPRILVEFDAALLTRPLSRADPRLFGYLARRARELSAALPAESSLSARAERELGSLLAQGEPSLAQVARRLAVSERTLHRRLADEGTGFAALLDAARRARAELLLGDPLLSTAEVAALLGYAEPSAFFRAFKRWTGSTPQAYRRLHARV